MCGDNALVVCGVCDNLLALFSDQTRLVSLKEKMSAGEKIDKDQMVQYADIVHYFLLLSSFIVQDAVSKLQSVEEQLEMLKDVQKQLSNLGTEVCNVKIPFSLLPCCVCCIDSVLEYYQYSAYIYVFVCVLACVCARSSKAK